GSRLCRHHCPPVRGVVEAAPGSAAQARPPSPLIRTVTVGPWVPQGPPRPCGRGSRALTAGGDFHPAPETRVLPHQQAYTQVGRVNPVSGGLPLRSDRKSTRLN